MTKRIPVHAVMVVEVCPHCRADLPAPYAGSRGLAVTHHHWCSACLVDVSLPDSSRRIEYEPLFQDILS